MKPGSPALQMDSLLSEPPGKPLLPICFKNLLPLKCMCCFLCAKGCPCGSDGKESTCNVRDLGLIPGLRRSPGKGNGYPLQCSGLENSMGRGGWQATVHEVTKSLIWLSDEHLLNYLTMGSKCNGYKVWTWKNSLVRQETHWLDLGINSRQFMAAKRTH